MLDQPSQRLSRDRTGARIVLANAGQGSGLLDDFVHQSCHGSTQGGKPAEMPAVSKALTAATPRASTAEKLLRVHGRLMNQHLIMQMRSGGPATRAHRSNDLPLLHLLPFCCLDFA
jgi:hypothetical protein